MAGLVHLVPWPAPEASALIDLILRSWVVLEGLDPEKFKVKPKMHLLVHLGPTCSRLGPPGPLWNYSEEDWGGKMAKLAMRRGGTDNPTQIAIVLLSRAAALLP